MTYGDVALRIDQGAQKCLDCGLEIPDPIKIRQFFAASEMGGDKRATVLMAAGSEYNWKSVKDKLDTLYPHVIKKKADSGRQPWKGHGAKTVNETSNESTSSYEMDPLEAEFMAGRCRRSSRRP